jgi:hypothetical protein
VKEALQKNLKNTFLKNKMGLKAAPSPQPTQGGHRTKRTKRKQTKRKQTKRKNRA